VTKFSTQTFAAALLAATLLCPVAQAADPSVAGPYVSGQVGYNHPVHDDGTLDNTASFAAAAGYRFNPNFRLEGELSYRKNDYSDTALGLTASGHVKGTALMLNGWYDFANSTAVTPYLGGGIGFARGAAKISEPVSGLAVDDSDTAFTYQLGGGAAFALTQNVALTADYRYVDTAKFSYDASVGGTPIGKFDAGDYRAHEIRAGVRYTF